MRPNLEEGLRAVQRLGVREVGIRLERAHLVRHERVDAREHLLERREELFALGCQFLVCLALLDVVDLQLQLLVVDVVCLPAGVLHVEHTHAELHHGVGMSFVVTSLDLPRRAKFGLRAKGKTADELKCSKVKVLNRYREITLSSR